MIELSEKQKQIVYAENGPIYVKASAGSGKTRVLTERVRHLLSLTSKKILALTFTNKAGEEIKERLRDITDIEKRVFVGTFHGFCQQMLENHIKLLGYEKMPHLFEDEADRLEIIEEAIVQTPSYVTDYRKQSEKDQKSFRYTVLSFISKIKRQLIADADIEQHTDDENVTLLYQNYQDILYAQNAIDFDDLLLLANSLLVEHPKIAALYRQSFFSICIDEAQDLNNAQYQFLISLTGGEFNNVLMVGDPNQSIYNFNGSSPDYMDKCFVADFSPLIIHLKENYRSSIDVLTAANNIIPGVEYIAEAVKKGGFEIHCLEDDFEEAQWVTNKIDELIQIGRHTDIEGKITFEKIAVLARNKYLFNNLEVCLKETNFPFYYKMTQGTMIFESTLLKIFDLALRVKLNPKDGLHKMRLLALLDVKEKNTSTIEEIAYLVTDVEAKRMLELIISLKTDGSNLKLSLEQFENELNIEDDNEKNMTINDINELLKHWHNYAKQSENKSLQQFKNSMALGQTNPLEQHSGISLSTVHSMKGQEFDIVFLIGMDDETFPDYRAIKTGGIEMIQEKNNLYVAFTRARRFLFVTWPKKRMMPWGDYKYRRISRFLNEF